MNTKTKKLYRSQKDKILFGVCGGLGEYFEIDTTIIRIVFVVLSLASGIGFIGYIIFAIIVPKEGDYKSEKRSEKIKEFAEEAEEKAKNLTTEAKQIKWDDREKIFGGVLIMLGVFLIIEKVFHIFNMWWAGKVFWPILVVLFGFFLLVRAKK